MKDFHQITHLGSVSDFDKASENLVHKLYGPVLLMLTKQNIKNIINSFFL